MRMVHIAVKKYLVIATITILSLSCNSRRSLEAGGLRLVEMENSGVARSFLVHVPKNETATLSPLLVVLHGAGGTAESVVKLTKQRFNELSDRDGFYVAYPSGLGKIWHAVDDVGFIAAMINRLASEYTIDKGRIFIAGISNGGLMSLRLACSLPGIRGIAAVAAAHLAGQEVTCALSRPINVMIINGTDDPIVPYDGGDVKLLGIKRGRVVPTDDTVRFWVGFNKCRGNGEEELLPDTDPDDRTRVKKISYNRCDGGTRVVLFRVEGGGHTWPGGWHYIPSGFIGYTSKDINACDEIWKFFKSSR